ncbi:MAG: T9SS type A sorting domain-containing protein [Bacteroidota bacterium]
MKRKQINIKLSLLTIIIALSGLSINAQSLQNTTWQVYDTLGTFLSYFRFGTDTLFSSMDNNTWESGATYTQSGNNFRIVDLPGINCPISDTGRYTFLIQNDTLKFTLVVDSCTDRSEALTTFDWVRLQTGIDDLTSVHNIKIYPNPVGDVVYIKTSRFALGSTYDVSDLSGKKIFNGKLLNETTSIDLRTLASGLYFLKIGENNKQTFKLVKQ